MTTPSEKRQFTPIDVDSWEQFEETLKELQNKRIQHKNLTAMQVSPFLYRGQGDASWPLFTTLERELQAIDNVTFSQYYRLIARIKPQIESFTGTHWNVREYPQYEKWAKEKDITLMLLELEKSGNVDEYRYMTYLRHHGFPSPLLDWTRSPYVAAYFSFAAISKTPIDQRPERVSIYVYWESPKGFRVHNHAFGNPYIHTFGPYVRTHQRHFLQQSQYTICIAYSEDQDEWRYTQHEEAFFRADEDQDVLFHYTIPSTEWRKVIRLIDAYNLNAYSLFGSEESLMQTLALRELHLSEKGL